MTHYYFEKMLYVDPNQRERTFIHDADAAALVSMKISHIQPLDPAGIFRKSETTPPI